MLSENGFSMKALAMTNNLFELWLRGEAECCRPQLVFVI